MRLLPVQKAKSIVLACPACSYETQKTAKTVQHLETGRDSIVIIGKKEQKIRPLPTVKMECPKCGHKEAFYWIVQTRGADESSTQFFRCTSCGSTWRETS